VRDHAVVSPRFWTGETGRALRPYPDAQRLALYLMTCPSSNMIGLYYLPIPTICHELNMTSKGASEALRRLSEGGFAEYDPPSEVVFVFEMARYQVGERLAANDNRIKAVERLLRLSRKTRFFNEFLEKYAEPFNLSVSPFEAPSDPLRSQEQDQGKEQEQEQEQEENSAADAASGDAVLPMVAIPPELDTEEFRVAWGEWKADRRERKLKAYTPRGETGQLKMLAKLGPSGAVACIEKSIRNQWQGLFPDRGETGGGNGPRGNVGRAGRANAEEGKYGGFDQGPGLAITPRVPGPPPSGGADGAARAG
jgi:hypothetical protein